MHNVEFSKEDNNFLNKMISSGYCKNANDFLHKSINALKEKLTKEEIEFKKLENSIQIGIEQINNNQTCTINIEDFLKEASRKMNNKYGNK